MKEPGKIPTPFGLCARIWIPQLNYRFCPRIHLQDGLHLFFTQHATMLHNDNDKVVSLY